MKTKKKILIYGDSNVWGDNFLTNTRIPDNKQWVNILKKRLKKKYQIFQEGLPGRIAGDYEIEKKYKNGKQTFLAIFRTHAPLDHIIIMLGTNDLQVKYNKTTQEIIDNLLWYETIIKKEYEDIDNQKKYFKNKKIPEIIYILPANFDYKETAKEIFDYNSEVKRQEIINYFQKNVKKSLVLDKMPLFNDGIHLNYEGHKLVADMVRSCYFDRK